MQQRAALVDALLVDQRGDVIPHRRRKLRLLVHEAHGVVGLETAQRAGNGLLGHAGRGGGMAQAGEARAPFRPRGRGEQAKGGDGRGKEASVVHGDDNSPSRLTRDNYRGKALPSFARRERASPPARGAFGVSWSRKHSRNMMLLFNALVRVLAEKKYPRGGTTGVSLGLFTSSRSAEGAREASEGAKSWTKHVKF